MVVRSCVVVVLVALFVCIYWELLGDDQTTKASIPSRMNGVNNNIYKCEIRGPALGHKCVSWGSG